MMFICCRLFFFLSFFLQVSHQSVKFFIFHFTGSQVDFVADQKGLNSFSTCHIKILLSQASTTPTTYNKPVEGGAVARISSDWSVLLEITVKKLLLPLTPPLPLPPLPPPTL